MICGLNKIFGEVESVLYVMKSLIDRRARKESERVRILGRNTGTNFVKTGSANHGGIISGQRRRWEVNTNSRMFE